MKFQKNYIFDHTELDLNDSELNALNGICDHLESLKIGQGIVVNFGGSEKLLFLAPLKSNKNRLSNISFIPVDYSQKVIQLPDSEEFLVALGELNSLKEVESIARALKTAPTKKIVHFDRFIIDLINAQEPEEFESIQDVLDVVGEADNLAELQYKLGVSKPVVLQGEKYAWSKYRGKPIEQIIYHACGIVFLETADGSFQFRIHELRPIDEVSGDFILCELQFEPDIDLSN